jgi:hypothetical protein
MFSLMDNIMIQTEFSLFSTRGNETMNLETGGDVFIGTGNVFEHHPKEFVDTELGSGGTILRYSGISTAAGRFYVDYDKKRIFLVALIKDKKTGSSAEGYEDLTLGMENWFNTNIPFTVLESYGFKSIDLPYTVVGFHMAYDQINKRLLLTKHDIDVTSTFTNDWVSSPSVTCNSGAGTIRTAPTNDRFQIWAETTSTTVCGWYDLDWHDTTYFKQIGWTLSYQLDMKVWVSFHSYIPHMYIYTTDSYYGLMSGLYLGGFQSTIYLFKHNDYNNIGKYYEATKSPYINFYPFEIEYTTHGKSDVNKQFYAIEVNDVITDFQLDASIDSPDGVKIQDIGFTSFYVYNRLQISDEVPLVPLSPTISGSGNYRSAGSIWTINNFRDESLLAATYVGGLPSYPSSGVSMFNADGTINTNYIDPAKTWDQKPKFVDKYLNIRLICDNTAGNFVTLLSSQAKFRPYFR